MNHFSEEKPHNKALHRTVFPLRSKAAGEFDFMGILS
jgi:hypothetical protein